MIVSTALSTKFTTLNSQPDWQFRIPYRLSLLPLHCIWQGFGCPHPAGSEGCVENSCFDSHRGNKRGAALQNNNVPLYNIQYTLHNIGGCAIIWTVLSCLFNHISGAELLLQAAFDIFVCLLSCWNSQANRRSPANRTPMAAGPSLEEKGRRPRHVLIPVHSHTTTWRTSSLCSPCWSCIFKGME